MSEEIKNIETTPKDSKDNEPLPTNTQDIESNTKDLTVKVLIEPDMPKGFFSDPKNWLPLFALAVSIIGTAYSIHYTSTSLYEQNRRWDAANISKLSLTKVYFFAWRIIPKDETAKYTDAVKNLRNPIKNSLSMK